MDWLKNNLRHSTDICTFVQLSYIKNKMKNILWRYQDLQWDKNLVIHLLSLSEQID